MTLKSLQVKHGQALLNGTSPGRKIHMFKGAKAEEEPFLYAEEWSNTDLAKTGMWNYKNRCVTFFLLCL